MFVHYYHPLANKSGTVVVVHICLLVTSDVYICYIVTRILQKLNNVTLLPCDDDVMASSCGNSLLLKCRVRVRAVDPCGTGHPQTPCIASLVHQSTLFGTMLHCLSPDFLGKESVLYYDKSVLFSTSASFLYCSSF